MRASYSSRPAEHCKSTPKNPPAATGPQRSSIPLTPAERARRSDALRTAPAGTAPLFQTRLRRGEEGDRT
ncbi:MAG: hypothetical protein JOZ63_18750 [Planctomycetaceae bacterium]|nr:hypothetical protein [Planctomycetaceae bacterium]MBV8384630.1 hypothetical protein [Planctomycetaceae bacterium]MBV8606091.1 hypothetical protein [Singulisphaera sp.]